MAVADADVVQESAPERLEREQQIWAEIDAAAKPDAPLASSSSPAVAARAVACYRAMGKRPQLLRREIRVEHLGQTTEETWASLGGPNLYEPTVALMSEQAQHFGGTRGEARDQTIIQLIPHTARDESSAPGAGHGPNWPSVRSVTALRVVGAGL